MRKVSFLSLAVVTALTASVALAAESKTWDVRLSNAIVESETLCDAQTSVLKAVVAHIAAHCDCGAKIEVVGYCNIRFSDKQRAELVAGWLRKELPGKEYEITVTAGGDDEHGHVRVIVECIPCPEKKAAIAPPPTPPPTAAPVPTLESEELHGAGYGLVAPEEPIAWPLVQVVHGTVFVRADAFEAPANTPIYFACDDNGWMVRHAYRNAKGKPGQDLKAVAAKDLHRDAMAAWQSSPPVRAADVEGAPTYYAFPVLETTPLKRAVVASTSQQPVQPILFNLVWFEYNKKGKLIEEHWLPVEDFPNDPHVIIRTDRTGKVVIASLILQPDIDF